MAKILIERELWNLLIHFHLLQDATPDDEQRIQQMLKDKAKADAARKVYHHHKFTK